MNQDITLDLKLPVRLVAAAGLFSSTCNIFDPNQEPDELGQVDLTDMTPVDGLQGLDCMKAPLVDGKVNPSFSERNPDSFREFQLNHVLLAGYYPSIIKRYVAQIDGEFFEIRNAESDSQQTMTRMAVRSYSL